MKNYFPKKKIYLINKMDKTLVFNRPLDQIMKSAKPVKKELSKKDFRLMRAGLDPIGISVIPPLNTNILFRSVLPTFKLPKRFRSIKLPDSFDWSKISPSDSSSIKAKKKMITPVPNQGMCGSCWAVAISGCISDCFVVSGKVEKNPNISSTYIMTCNFDNQNMMGCSGGNPAVACKEISRNGCTSESCINYEIFCNSENGCRSSKGSEAHFEADTETMNETLLNMGCGCVDSSIKHNLFFISPPTVHDRSERDESSNPDIIKQLILEQGPVLAGFHVYPNFRGGNWSGTNGIYLENYIYDVDGNATYVEPMRNDSPTSPNNYIGGHAVVVLGWGSSMIDGNKVDYWITRNSWGENWGDGGYFKMAMYGEDPRYSNQVSQFDRSVIVDVMGSRFQAGGMISFSPLFYKETLLDQANISSDNPEIDNPIFYQKDDVKSKKITSNKIEKPFYKTDLFTILFILLVLFILWKYVTKKGYKQKFNNRFLYSMDY